MTVRHSYICIFVLVICALLQGCRSKDYATAVDGSDGPLVIYPDYKDVTIPVNIAPLNFHYEMKGVRNVTTTFTAGGNSVRFNGTDVEWSLRKWKSFISLAGGQTISVEAEAEVDGKKVSDRWSIHLIEDKIDPYLTYRLIEPSYQMWHEVSINERCIENFEETVINDYRHTDNACMNCHIHGQQRGDLSIYYVRGPQGGAILNRDGKLRKLTLSTEDMISGTVYGELHPSGRYGVFSTNIILPGLHSGAGLRMEIYDSRSDLAVADFDRNVMVISPHIARSDVFETFPCFSPDGEYVYYCAADSVQVPEKIKDLKYSLMRAAFDTATGRISEQADTLWSACLHNASACHPKVSPDGRWLMFTVADYGTFPLYHSESTLNLIDLETGEVRALDSIKGDKSDTYHSWSSDSGWFVFTSKRGDSQYGKPYLCHLDEYGRPTKPFVLPQKSSHFYDITLKSFNIPDLGRSSTGMTVRDARRMFKAESEAFGQVTAD